MTGFDFVFALFSLVLGLAAVEVLGGLAGVMKLHARARAGKARDVRVGWLTPLLAILILLNQLSVLMYAHGVRETMPFGYLTLVGVLVIVGAYYLFSAIVFPDDPGEWPDFDLWYDQNNRLILSGILAINLVMQLVSARLRPPPSTEQAALIASDGPMLLALVASFWLQMILLAVLIFAKGRRLNAILLATVILLTLGQAVGVNIIGMKNP